MSGERVTNNLLMRLNRTKLGGRRMASLQGMGVAFQKGPQSVHLLPSAERHKFAGNWPLHAADQRPHIARTEGHSPHEERRVLHLIDDPEGLPNRMGSESVVLYACLKNRPQFAVLRSAHCAMVHAYLVGKGP